MQSPLQFGRMTRQHAGVDESGRVSTGWSGLRPSSQDGKRGFCRRQTPSLLFTRRKREDRGCRVGGLFGNGFALLAPVAYAMVGLVGQRGAWIANPAGLFAVLGLSTLPGLVWLDYFSVGVEQVAGVDVAFDAQTAAEGLPGFAALAAPALVTSMLAGPVALLALWRAGLVDGGSPWWRQPLSSHLTSSLGGSLVSR
jgi:hypothetical protein